MQAFKSNNIIFQWGLIQYRLTIMEWIGLNINLLAIDSGLILFNIIIINFS